MFVSAAKLALLPQQHGAQNKEKPHGRIKNTGSTLTALTQMTLHCVCCYNCFGHKSPTNIVAAVF